MLRTGPGARHKEQDMGVGWIQSEGPGVRSQDESITGNLGKSHSNRGREQTQSPSRMEGKERQQGREPLWEGDSGRLPGQWLQGKGTFDSLHAKELQGGLGESVS